MLRTEQRHDPATGASYPWLHSTTAMVNHFYFYVFDDDFRTVLPEVLFVLPLQREAVHQRARVSEAAVDQAKHRVRAARQRHPGLRGPGGDAAAGRRVDGQEDRRAACASGWPGCRTRSRPATGSRASATTSRCCRPNSRAPRFSDGRWPDGSSSRKLEPFQPRPAPLAQRVGLPLRHPVLHAELVGRQRPSFFVVRRVVHDLECVPARSRSSSRRFRPRSSPGRSSGSAVGRSSRASTRSCLLRCTPSRSCPGGSTGANQCPVVEPRTSQPFDCR